MWGKKHTVSKLGIPGLPQAAGQIQPGRIVAILSHHPAARESLIAGLVVQNIKSQRIAITQNAPPESLMRLMESVGIDGYAACRNEELVVFTLSTDCKVQADKFGAQACIEEFDYFALPTSSLIIIEGAEQLFSSTATVNLHKTLKTIRRWTHARQHKLVLLFSEEACTENLRQRFRVEEGALDGLVFLDSDGGHYNWNIDYWITSEATLSSRAFSLGLGESNTLLIATGAEIDTLESTVRAAPDQDRVVAAKAAIDEEKGIPVHWESVNSLDEILEQSKDMVAATIILVHDNATEFEHLLKVIHTLRRQCGRGLKLVIRERTKRLRYTHELLLTALGANLVVYADVSFSRFLSLLRGLHGQRFNHEITADFDAALSMIMPPRASGYLPPQSFAATVIGTLERGQAMGLESALTRLTINPEIPHLETLRACRTKRPGDIFTVDKDFLYIFLFACREPDIDATLERLINVPLGVFFEAEVRFPTYESILPVISKIEQQEGLIDYSTMLAEHLRQQGPAQPQATELTAPLPLAFSPPFHNSLPAMSPSSAPPSPRTAERRPLHPKIVQAI